MREAKLRVLGTVIALGACAGLGTTAPAHASAVAASGWVSVVWDGPEDAEGIQFAVFVSRNGAGFPPIPETLTDEPQFVLEGALGEVASVRVAAYDPALGLLGSLSPASASVHFGDPDDALHPDSRLRNGSFEDGTGQSPRLRLYGGDEIPGWEVFGDSVDWSRGFAAFDGDRVLELHGEGPGGIRQYVDTVPGGLYRVRLALAGHPEGGAYRKTLVVEAGDASRIFTFDTDGRSREDMGWVRVEEFEFEAEEWETALDLYTIGRGAFGPVVDAVELVPLYEPDLAPPEPEPEEEPVGEPEPVPEEEPEPEPEPGFDIPLIPLGGFIP